MLFLFSHPVMSDSLRPHGLQHERLPCPSLSSRTCPNSCSLHRRCDPAISSCDILFSFCPQSFPASGTFPMNHLFISDDESTGGSVSASVLPMNIQCWSPLRLTCLISLLAKGLSGVSPAPQFKGVNSLAFCLLYRIALTMERDHWEDHSLDYVLVLFLHFNTLSRFVIVFLPRSNRLLISRLRSPSAVILEPTKRESVTASTFSPSICHEVMGPDAMILVFLIFSLKPAYHSPPSPSSRGSLVPLCFLPLAHIWGCWSPPYLDFSL